MANYKKILRKIRVANMATVFVYAFIILGVSFPLFNATADNVDVLELQGDTEAWRPANITMSSTQSVEVFNYVQEDYEELAERIGDNSKNANKLDTVNSSNEIELNAMDVDDEPPIFSYAPVVNGSDVLYVGFDVEDRLSNVQRVFYEIVDSSQSVVLSADLGISDIYDAYWYCTEFGVLFDTSLPLEFGNQSCYPFGTTIDIESLNDGDYTAIFCAEDTEGNIGTTATSTIPTGANGDYCYEYSFTKQDLGVVFEASLSPDTISPDNDGVDDFTNVEYTISGYPSVSKVYVYVTDDIDIYSANYVNHIYTSYVDGEYSFEWNGDICTAADFDDYFCDDLQTAPAGQYYIKVIPIIPMCISCPGDDEEGLDSIILPITVENAQTEDFFEASLAPDVISPNGDGVDDFTTISYGISQAYDDERVAIFVTDDAGYDNATVVDILDITYIGGTYNLDWDGTICTKDDYEAYAFYECPEFDAPDGEYYIIVAPQSYDLDILVLPITIDTSVDLDLVLNSITPTPQYAPATFNMTASSSEDVTYIWELDGNGDYMDASGTGLADTKDSITFTTPGTYILGVKAIDSAGNVKTETVEVTVVSNELAVNITADHIVDVLEGETVNYVANVTRGQLPYSYQWTGDCIDVNLNTTTAIAEGVTVLCSIEVTDGNGDVVTATYDLEVLDNVPIVVANIDITSPLEGDDVIVYAEILNGSGNAPFIYDWSVDCTGSEGYFEIKDVIFDKEYVCTVKVTDADDDVAEATVRFTPGKNIPEVSISTYPLIIKEGDVVSLRAEVKNGNPEFEYAWEGCSTAETQDINLGALATGSYTCKVVVTDADGDKGEASYTLVVNDNKPTVKISASPSNKVYVGTVVTLTAKVEYGNLPIVGEWSGACSGTGTTAKVSSIAGTYKCTYTVVDADNDIASASYTVAVVNKPVVVEPITPIFVPPVDAEEVKGVQDEEEDKEESDTDSEEKLTETQKLTGRLYEDENNNGKYDEGETVFEDVTLKVYLLDEDGERELIDVVTTDKDGEWEIEGIDGQYIIEITDGIDGEFEVIQDEDGFEFDESSIDLAIDVEEQGSLLWLWILGGAVLFFVGIVVLSKNNNE